MKKLLATTASIFVNMLMKVSDRYRIYKIKKKTFQQDRNLWVKIL